MDFKVNNSTQNHKVSIGDITLNYRFRRGIKPGLIVAFDGWDPDVNYAAPASYSKFKIFKSFGYSCLYFSHPELKGRRVSHSIFIGLLKSMVIKNPIFSIIQGARAALKQDLVFYGRSSGGYAALYYGMCSPRSYCLVINPEIDVLAHKTELIMRYMPTYKLLFPIGKMINLSGFNLKGLILSSKFLPNVLYFQSISDAEYLENHAKPFIESYNSRLIDCVSGRLSVSYVASDLGHGYDLSKDDLLMSIETLLSYKASKNKASVNSLGCRPIYRKTTNLKIFLKIHVSFFIDEKNENKLIRFFYKSESQHLIDGFSCDSKGLFFMDLSTENGVMEQTIKFKLPCDFSTLYVESLGECVAMHDFSLSVVDYYENE